MSISIGKVTIVSIFVECILYGFFTFMFAVSVYVLLIKRRSKKERVNRPMLVVSITMFILATVHVGADLQRLLEAYLIASDSTAYLSMVNTAIYALKSTAYCAQTLVGDGFMLYRLFLIWGGDRRICFPILICFIASIGVGIGALQGFARASPTAPVFISELHDWIVSFFSLTLFTNFSCTLLIAARILWVHKHVSGVVAGGPSVFPAAMIIIESGMIYSACLIILLSLYLSGSFAQYIVLDAVTQVIGVVFSLIIVRVGLGLSTDAATYTNQTFMSTFAAQAQGNKQRKEHSGLRAGAGTLNPMHRNNPRPQRPVFSLTSTIGGGGVSEIDTRGSVFVAMSGDQTDTTLSTNSSSTRFSGAGGHKKGLVVGLTKPQPFGYLPENDLGNNDVKAETYADTEGSIHPFDGIDKSAYTDATRSFEDLEYAENHELRDRIRVTRTVEVDALDAP